MTAWTFIITPAAERELAKLSKPVRVAILSALERLALEMNNPVEPRTSKLKKLGGRGDDWRLRAGDYRVIFRHDGGRLVILVLKAGHRGNVYQD